MVSAEAKAGAAQLAASALHESRAVEAAKAAAYKGGVAGSKRGDVLAHYSRLAAAAASSETAPPGMVPII